MPSTTESTQAHKEYLLILRDRRDTTKAERDAAWQRYLEAERAERGSRG